MWVKEGVWMNENPMEVKFLERLNQLFDSDPRTDTAISDALGVSKQTVSYWRQGSRSPKRRMILQIAEMYHVSPMWLMGFDEQAAVTAEVTPTEMKLLTAWRGAEATYQTVALEILENHQKGDGKI